MALLDIQAHGFALGSCGPLHRLASSGSLLALSRRVGDGFYETARLNYLSFFFLSVIFIGGDDRDWDWALPVGWGSGLGVGLFALRAMRVVSAWQPPISSSLLPCVPPSREAETSLRGLSRGSGGLWHGSRGGDGADPRGIVSSN
jgi:hypothetical protein